MSVAVHTVGLGWIAMAALGSGAPDPVAEPPPPPPPPAAMIEVALFDEPAATPPIETRGASAPAARSTPRVAVAVPTPAASPDEPPAAPPPMRGTADLRLHDLPASPDTSPTRWVVQPPAIAPRPSPASPDSGALDPTATHEAFSVRVDPDGSAHLDDARNVRFALHLPTRKDIAARLAAWHAELDEDPRGHDDAPHDRDDAERPIEHPIRSIGVTIVKFDVTDWLMRAHGQDPYASAKLSQLDATRDERAQIGAQHRHARLGHAGELMQQNLDALWAAERDPAARKQALFELWDECSETGSDDVVAAGSRARAGVASFIRDHLPAGTAGAFTAAEIDALNERRQSTAPFQPY